MSFIFSPTSMRPSRQVPPPPESPDDLLVWADKHGVTQRLDDVFIGQEGPAGSFLPGRPGEVLTYRQVLLEPADQAEQRRPARGGNRYFSAQDAKEEALDFLRRMATLLAAHRANRARMDEEGRDPQDPVLAAFLEQLRDTLQALSSANSKARRPPGTYEPVVVKVARDPAPLIGYQELSLADRAVENVLEEQAAILLLGWNEGPWRWGRTRRGNLVTGDVPPDKKLSAIEAMIDFVRDPRAAAEQQELGELLRLPAWRFALGTLDESLARLEAAAPASRGLSSPGRPPNAAQERLAFRVTVTGEGELNVEPVVQKRSRAGAFSRGSRLQWFSVPDRRDLTAADRRAYQAYDDRFARVSTLGGWGSRALTAAQLFGILRALIDHPAVFLDTDRGAPHAGGGAAGAVSASYTGGRLDIRQGRLRLRFMSGAEQSLTPQFDLLGVTLLASEVAQALGDDHHVIYLHRPDGQAPQLLLAQVTPQAAAMVRALALAPARFPADAHDALATRLESLQEAVDIEFPSHWTRTIAPADGRLLARIELLASGAIQVRLAVRPVRLGPVFAPGEGPALVLEGQGSDRHGARRDRQNERQTAHALAERLGLGGGEELEPWCWRVGEGDPALHVVATLKDLGEDKVLVEWADDGRLTALGSVGRADMRMKVADRRDWFAVEGGAAVKRPSRRGQAQQTEVVPLADLMAAIREDKRYVRVGAQGFVRIEDSLREALARAAGAMFLHHHELQVSAQAHDSLLGLIEDEAQVEASTAFTALRRRVLEGAAVTPQLPADLATKLRPYQMAGVVWMTRLAHWGAGAILADEMGLGKTVQTLAVLLHRAAAGPALVVAPTSVVGNWVDEAARFVPQLKLRLYRGSEREGSLRGLGPGDLVVTSYAIATLDGEALAQQRFASLVLDEAQAVKNSSTERAKALRALDADWRLALTGTPIENHLGELWSLLRVISPGLLGSWEQFRARYAVPIEKFGVDERRRALTALLRPFLLRRLKSEVARDLPARTEITKTVQLSADEQRLYDELRQSTLDELERKKKDRDRDGRDYRFVLLAALTRLRQLCCHPRLVYPRTQAGSAKAAYLLQMLAELRDGGHKVLVFSQFRSFLDLLQPRLAQHGFRILVLDGTTPAEQRERRIAAFQAGEADLFLISLKAGGFGLNLTAADTVVHLDPWWNPAVEDQATARAHRMGQQRPVTAVRLVARGTIEEAVMGLHAAKRALAAAVLEGSDLAASLDTDALIDLIRGSATGSPESPPI